MINEKLYGFTGIRFSQNKKFFSKLAHEERGNCNIYYIVALTKGVWGTIIIWYDGDH